MRIVIYNKFVEICRKYETTRQPITATTDIGSEAEFLQSEGVFVSVKVKDYSIRMLIWISLDFIQFRFAETPHNQTISYSDPDLFDKMDNNIRNWFENAAQLK